MYHNLSRLKMSVGIVGLGYVGLSMAVCLASRNTEVRGYDIDEEKMKKLKSGEPYIVEDSLKELMELGIKTGALMGAASIHEVVNQSDIIFICVGTPSKKDGSINLDYIFKAAQDIGEGIKNTNGYKLIVTKSTVTPGTAEEIIKIVEKASSKKHGVDFGVCSNPEFLREGTAVLNFTRPDRIVIGASTEGEAAPLIEMYKNFYGDLPNIILTNYVNAELIKYANNAFLATKISFINEIAMLCEKIPGADINTIRDALYADARIGPSFLNAGVGYGGSCFGKDLKALISFYTRYNRVPYLLRSTEAANDRSTLAPVVIIAGDIKRLGLCESKKQKIAVLGLAFKSGTDDVRDSSSLKIIRGLQELGFKNISAHDPEAVENARRVLGDSVKFEEYCEEALWGADWAIIATAWDEYIKIEPATFIKLMKTPNVFDGRRIYNSRGMKECGVNYYATGYGRY